MRTVFGDQLLQRSVLPQRFMISVHPRRPQPSPKTLKTDVIMAELKVQEDLVLSFS